MNEHHLKSKPIFMDEELLHMAVVDRCAQGQAERIAKEEGIHFNEVLKLNLEYRNILKIDHLWEFTLLTRLDLNNNLIQKIEGVDHLINLTWLNLSFNDIEKIEGLESLRNLEVLNLSNNRISILENMNALEKLTLFCISNNLLGQLDDVLCLRKFKNLFTLNIFGNPFSTDEDYKLLITAYFPNLKFLDNRYLNEKTRDEASAKYHYVVEKMKSDELRMEQAAEAELSRNAELQRHKDAFVENLNGSQFFKNMIKDDPEAEKFSQLSGVDALLQAFEQRAAGLCVKLFQTGLSEHERRETEVESFFSGQAAAETDYRRKTSQILAAFDQRYGEMKRELRRLSDPELLEAKAEHCRREISLLCGSLVTQELQLISLLEDLTNRFNTNISDMVGNFIETAAGIFSQLRELEVSYHEKVRGIASAALEAVAQESPEEVMPDDVRMLFTDKDAAMEAVAVGHDNHLLKINDRETQLVTAVNHWKVALIKKIQDEGLRQHRIRVSDIHRYTDYLRERLRPTP